jgi:hypothetical protein
MELVTEQSWEGGFRQKAKGLESMVTQLEVAKATWASWQLS